MSGRARRALAAEVERLAGDLRGPLARVEDAVTTLLEGEDLPPDVPANALFEGGIPRIRPLLVVLAARIPERAAGASDGADADAMEVAAVAELLQRSIVLHDAALGPRDGRRRRAARRVLRGATAWFGGSHLTLRALELARRAPSPEVLGEALDALRELTEGHALGQALRERPVDVQDALLHAESHAGVIFAFACRAGGRLAGASRPELTALGRYGRHLGVAWQVAEDLAVFERGAEALAREAATARPILPVVAAAGRHADLAARWRALGAGHGDAATLADAIRAAGGLQTAREALVQRAWAAQAALAGLPETPARVSLARIADALARGTDPPR